MLERGRGPERSDLFLDMQSRATKVVIRSLCGKGIVPEMRMRKSDKEKDIAVFTVRQRPDNSIMNRKR